MPSLRDIETSASVYRPARLVAWGTLAVMALTVVYALVIVTENWSAIGV